MNWWNRMVCAVVGHQVGTVPVTESFWWRNDAGWQHELRLFNHPGCPRCSELERHMTTLQSGDALRYGRVAGFSLPMRLTGSHAVLTAEVARLKALCGRAEEVLTAADSDLDHIALRQELKEASK